MRKLFPMLAVAVLFSGVSLFAVAAEEKTITGEGQCAKCSLNEKAQCQNAVVVNEGGQKTTYYLTGDVSKAFHSKLCKTKKQVKATGTVKEEDGEKVMEVSKIELVEQ